MLLLLWFGDAGWPSGLDGLDGLDGLSWLARQHNKMQWTDKPKYLFIRNRIYRKAGTFSKRDMCVSSEWETNFDCMKEERERKKSTGDIYKQWTDTEGWVRQTQWMWILWKLVFFTAKHKRSSNRNTHTQKMWKFISNAGRTNVYERFFFVDVIVKYSRSTCIA